MLTIPEVSLSLSDSQEDWIWSLPNYVQHCREFHLCMRIGNRIEHWPVACDSPMCPECGLSVAHDNLRICADLFDDSESVWYTAVLASEQVRKRLNQRVKRLGASAVRTEQRKVLWHIYANKDVGAVHPGRPMICLGPQEALLDLAEFGLAQPGLTHRPTYSGQWLKQVRQLRRGAENERPVPDSTYYGPYSERTIRDAQEMVNKELSERYGPAVSIHLIPDHLVKVVDSLMRTHLAFSSKRCRD